MHRTHFVLIGLGLLGLGLAVTAVAQTGPSPAEVGKLIDHDAAFIRAALAKAKFEKKAQDRVRIAAQLIAHYAQSSLGKDDAKNAALATLRDRALSLLKAVDDGKVADARKLALGLSADMKADPGAKTELAPLAKYLDIKVMMQVFSLERFGGFGLEDKLLDMAKLTDPLDADEAAKIQRIADKVAFIGSLSISYAPAKGEGKKTKKLWTELAKETQAVSLELAVAAKSKQGSAVAKAADKLNTVCVRCHDVFR